MSALVFCADCGTECALVDGREVDAHDPEIADVRVWACPTCARAWARHDLVADAPIGAPAGPETRSARALLAARMVAPLVEQAPPNERALAADRVAGFLAAHLGLPREVGTVDHLDLLQCRQAWRILREATYADVRAWAREYRGRKAKAA